MHKILDKGNSLKAFIDKKDDPSRKDHPEIKI
jgi:hypothetical protein